MGRRMAGWLKSAVFLYYLKAYLSIGRFIGSGAKIERRCIFVWGLFLQKYYLIISYETSFHPVKMREKIK
jgi:hypothetical protein